MRRFFGVMASGTALVSVLVLAGCATGGDCRKPMGESTLTPAVAAVDDRGVGRYQTWGGRVVRAGNLEDSTELEIVAYPLNRCGRPDTASEPIGRFISVQQGYLETADLEPGRKVTVTGRITGVRDGRVGEASYRFPVLDGAPPRLWPEERTGQFERWPRFGVGIGGGSGGWSGGSVGVWF